jgi:hypothetical protein
MQLMEGTRANFEQALLLCFESGDGTKAMEISEDASPLISVVDTGLKGLFNILVRELRDRRRRVGIQRRDLDHRGVVKSLEENLVIVLFGKCSVEEILLEFALSLNLIRALWTKE